MGASPGRLEAVAAEMSHEARSRRDLGGGDVARGRVAGADERRRGRCRDAQHGAEDDAAAPNTAPRTMPRRRAWRRGRGDGGPRAARGGGRQLSDVHAISPPRTASLSACALWATCVVCVLHSVLLPTGGAHGGSVTMSVTWCDQSMRYSFASMRPLRWVLLSFERSAES